MPLTVETASALAQALDHPDRRWDQGMLHGGLRAPDGAAFTGDLGRLPTWLTTVDKAMAINTWLVPDAQADAFADALAQAWSQGRAPALVGLWVGPDRGSDTRHLVGCWVPKPAPSLSGAKVPQAFREVLAGSPAIRLTTDRQEQWAFSLAEPLCAPLLLETTSADDARQALASLDSVIEAILPREHEDLLVALNDHLQEAADRHRRLIDAWMAQHKADRGLR